MLPKSKRQALQPKKLQRELLSRSRVQELLLFETQARAKGFERIAGIDEAGRGPLAGPVIAAACLLPEGFLPLGVDDSKKLTPLQRQKLFTTLTTHSEVVFALGEVSSQEIDQINIYQATLVAMEKAVRGLLVKPDILLCDAMSLNVDGLPCEKIIKGDSRSLSIAAASIIAKVSRDEMMATYHKKWPEYGFSQHKGYGTKKHVEAIHRLGPCEIHRMTFEPLKSLPFLS
jgi:ribonuclease HII